jgi:hypothetical protein
MTEGTVTHGETETTEGERSFFFHEMKSFFRSSSVFSVAPCKPVPSVISVPVPSVSSVAVS